MFKYSIKQDNAKIQYNDINKKNFKKKIKSSYLCVKNIIKNK